MMRRQQVARGGGSVRGGAPPAYRGRDPARNIAELVITASAEGGDARLEFL